MGRARILDHIGDGEYSIDYLFRYENIEARIAAMNAQITELDDVIIPALELQEQEILTDLDNIELSNSILIEALNAGDLENPTIPTVDENDFLALINAERSAASVPAVSSSVALRSTGQVWAGYHAEVGYRAPNINSITPTSTAAGFGYSNPTRPVLQIFCGGARSATEAVTTWMRRPFTAAIINDEDWEDWGFGLQITNDRYKYYWVCVFGTQGAI